MSGLKVGRRLRIKGVVCKLTSDPVRGTVTGLRDGEFRVTYDSADTCPCHGRRPGQPRSRYWLPVSALSNFELL